jgi:hypothetical protein
MENTDTPIPDFYLPKSELGQKFYHDFNDLVDFVWKLPEFVKQQRSSEAGKLEEYFPLSGNQEQDREALLLRGMRTQLHCRRLNEVFPDSVASASFLIGVSWHERNLLLLCKKLSAKLTTDMQKVHGIGGLWKFLQMSGVPAEHSRSFEEVKVAYEIRNCLIHAGGLVEFSNSTSKLTSIVDGKTYLPDRLRAKPQTKNWNPRVDLVGSELGDTVRLNAAYAYLATNLLKENACDLCDLSYFKHGDLTS